MGLIHQMDPEEYAMSVYIGYVLTLMQNGHHYDVDAKQSLKDYFKQPEVSRRIKRSGVVSCLQRTSMNVTAVQTEMDLKLARSYNPDYVHTPVGLHLAQHSHMCYQKHCSVASLDEVDCHIV